MAGDVAFHKDYYKKFDSVCDSLSKSIQGYNAHDTKFLSFVQEQRNKRIIYGEKEHGAMRNNYGKRYMLSTGARSCIKQCEDYTKTNSVVCLYDALNYLMIEYLFECYNMQKLDEVDVLDVFYTTVSDSSDSLIQLVYAFMDMYNNYHEQGYLLLTALAIRDELYECKLMGYEMEWEEPDGSFGV